MARNRKPFKIGSFRTRFSLFLLKYIKYYQTGKIGVGPRTDFHQIGALDMESYNVLYVQTNPNYSMIWICPSVRLSVRPSVPYLLGRLWTDRIQTWQEHQAWDCAGAKSIGFHGNQTVVIVFNENHLVALILGPLDPPSGLGDRCIATHLVTKHKLKKRHCCYYYLGHARNVTVMSERLASEP